MMKRFVCAITFVVGLLNAVLVEAGRPRSPEPMRGLTPQEVVDEMGIGINLGNTLDVRNVNKTYWGNPETTEEIVDGILSAGFTTLRLPVTWYPNMGEGPDYVVDTEYLKRVEEIVSWALDRGVYVILNTHHEGHWVIPNYENIDATSERLEKVWTQIANHFKNYGDRLIFETLNEPRVEGGGTLWGEWSGGTAETRDCVNRANKACVSAIRATGSNNSVRMLMVPTHAASADVKAMADWEAPNNDPNVIVSVHAYAPYQFCLTNQDADWGTDTDKRALDNLFEQIHETIVVGMGRAVVMGEWGSQNNGLGNELDRIRHADYYANRCVDYGISPVVWDDGGKFKLFDRRELNWSSRVQADTVLVPLFGQSFALFQETASLSTGAEGDEDGDGQANILEYAFGSDPNDAGDLSLMPRLEVVGGSLTIVSQRADVNVQYIVECSENLASDSWRSLLPIALKTSVLSGIGGRNEVRQEIEVDKEQSYSTFLRLRIED
ncbi:glycoside hydrolase family 5 protein [Pelagicoccus sp. SDUM812005]|uniref:glycoside hydrolase family 5 protein n=1 Tax=Pelagicoccus sp. SDUM812005 TaxID=3041257 RepID=UPI00280E15FD|nr:glycoside hydrolase family 5 protein [Pelagicoccus sp. SDUM812005]MDQ8180323.1 glycoside hydrolase family 5 protein [Pelagicoccus sp. SDUM812005]